MESTMVNALGSRIVALREAQGMTQGQLAAYAHVKRSWLSLVETGERERPNADDLNKVARALGVDVNYLLTGQKPQVVDVSPEAIGEVAEFSRLSSAWRRWALEAVRSIREVVLEGPMADQNPDAYPKNDSASHQSSEHGTESRRFSGH